MAYNNLFDLCVHADQYAYMPSHMNSAVPAFISGTHTVLCTVQQELCAENNRNKWILISFVKCPKTRKDDNFCVLKWWVIVSMEAIL